LAAEAGITHFLDVGTGIPTQPNVHQIAQGITPAARVVYVDNDPIVLAHARALLTSTAEGKTSYVDAHLRNPARILEEARRLLDFDRPVAVILLGVLHLIRDSEDPWAIVDQLMAAVPSGSYLAISHPALEINPGQQEAQRRYNERVSTPQTLRTQPEVARFFTGLELVEPGLVQVHQWRPESADPVPDDGATAHGGLARKP
jgi:hypothetical protein